MKEVSNKYAIMLRYRHGINIVALLWQANNSIWPGFDLVGKIKSYLCSLFVTSKISIR